MFGDICVVELVFKSYKPGAEFTRLFVHIVTGRCQNVFIYNIYIVTASGTTTTKMAGQGTVHPLSRLLCNILVGMR